MYLIHVYTFASILIHQYITLNFELCLHTKEIKTLFITLITYIQKVMIKICFNKYINIFCIYLQKYIINRLVKIYIQCLVNEMFAVFFISFLFLQEVTKVVQPLLLGKLIRYFTSEPSISETEAYLYAMGMSLSVIILAIFHHPYFFTVQRIGMQIRVACCSLLYRKVFMFFRTLITGFFKG